MIHLEGVSRTYLVGGRPVHALVEISEEILSGEYVAIMGPSGSGKSTLLNILGCLDRPSEGRYLLEEQRVGDLDDGQLARLRGHSIGFIFQAFHLVGRLSAAANVELPMIFAGISRAERRQRAASALESVGLADRAGHRPDQLSGGERQRVAIARAMVMEPRLLLADEPTGNLDSASGSQVIEVLEEMNRAGLTLVVVTHDPGVAGRAQRVLVLADGRVARRLTGAEIGRPLS